MNFLFRLWPAITSVVYPLAAAMFGGIALASALAPHDIEGLAFVMFAPVLAVASKQRPLIAIGLGLLTGLSAGASYVGWHHDTQRLFWAYLPFLWVAVIMAALCLLSSRLRGASPGAWMLAIATTAVAIEFATTLAPLPINIAVAVYKLWPLLALSSITGIWGASFVVWLCNAFVASVIVCGRFGQAHWKAVGASVVAVVVWYFLLLSMGTSRTHLVTVAAIQDFTGDETMSLTEPPKVPGDREAMSKAVAATMDVSPFTVIVWSEECLGSSFHTDNPRDETVKLVRKIGVPLVVGYNDDAKPKPHNLAAWLSPEGKILGVHRKEHLYLGESETIQAGKGGEAFDTPWYKAGLEVCFDTNYTGVTREEVQKGAQIILVPNYDPPTPRGTLHYLHASLVPFRAAENSVPIVRCDSNGLSQVIDRMGNVVAQGPLYQPATVRGTVAISHPESRTYFTRFGDWFAWLCVLGAVGLVRRNTGRRPTPPTLRAGPSPS
ncbi:MAG TPA: nitrilase-related carbon-nitrogen hydrolase [Capsulimonadaceae bacterium]|jgi:apolipoprotein N-acyltransferase